MVVVLSAKFQKDLLNKNEVIDKGGFVRFQFKTGFV